MLNLGPASLAAVTKLAEQELSMWPEQDARPSMPKDISEIESDELSRLFTELTAWSNFAAGQLAAAQVDEYALNKKKDHLEAKLFLEKDSAKVKGERVTRINREVAADERMEKLENELTHAYAYRKMVEVISNNFERDVALVSREITRRTNDFRANRKDRLGS